ncbi:MFS transporter [Streptomyces sp900116325]|uniref:MFS transporter n=1 Tax=Streptomyces sp. 900116325 TaxID=3154295 RepID=UPI0033A6B4C2
MTGHLDTATAAATRPALPRPYLVWLAGTRASLLGAAAMYFALGWAASAHGGAMAAVVLTAINLPRTILLLLGGAVGDRFGARRVMIVGDTVTAALVLAVVSFHVGPRSWLLVMVAVVIGTVDAFYLPATGSMPRRLVSKEHLPRALAMRQAGGQISSPLGAVLVASAGLSGAALVDAGTFAVVLVVLLCVRLAFDVERSSREESLLAGAVDGVWLAMKGSVLRSALLLTAAAAGFLLPVMSLLNPLLAREHGWGAGAAGLVAAGQGVGMIVVSLVVTRRGAMSRMGIGASVGLCCAALGIAAVATAPASGVAGAGGIVVGAGSGMFACHIGPLLLTSVPETHLSRMQVLLTLVRSLALVVVNNSLGVFAEVGTATTGAAVCAVAVCSAGIMGLASKPLRGLRRG